MDKRTFVIEELMLPGFIEKQDRHMVLLETIDSGKSKLVFSLTSDQNLLIENADLKKTELQFFVKDKGKSMFKRVDHIVFENISENDWILHIIEMKSWVGREKWKEIKGKFRASYLIAQGIAAMLEMNIVGADFYTTYERVDLSPMTTMPSARRLGVGEKQIRPQDEWNGGKFSLNFGERISYIHHPLQMIRDSEGVLIGEFDQAAI